MKRRLLGKYRGFSKRKSQREEWGRLRNTHSQMSLEGGVGAEGLRTRRARKADVKKKKKDVNPKTDDIYRERVQELSLR